VNLGTDRCHALEHTRRLWWPGSAEGHPAGGQPPGPGDGLRGHTPGLA
jgi:hypothetical protein